MPTRQGNRWHDDDGHLIFEGDEWELLPVVDDLRAKDASNFQPEAHTEGKDDKWLILALRMLGQMGREDVTEGLEGEVDGLVDLVDKLRTQLSTTLEALEFSEGAIVDAIGCEDGLDGSDGEAVLGMISPLLVKHGRLSRVAELKKEAAKAGGNRETNN